MQVASYMQMTSPESVEDQVTIVNKFASENFFQLNINKCETSAIDLGSPINDFTEF